MNKFKWFQLQRLFLGFIRFYKHAAANKDFQPLRALDTHFDEFWQRYCQLNSWNEQ